MALCQPCQRVNVPNLVSELDQVPDEWEWPQAHAKPRGMLHLLDARQLPPSAAAGCSLCALIIDAILQYDDSSTTAQSLAHAPLHPTNRALAALVDALVHRPIYLRPNCAPLKPAFPEDDVDGAWHVRGFKAFVPVDHGLLTAQIRLFAPPESAAAVSCEIIGRPTLPSSDSPQAYELITRWINACLAKHEACRVTFSGAVVETSTPTPLPTRLIHIDPTDLGIQVQLMETSGKTGHYVALSHCWGTPGNKKPLMTTKATLASHMTGIPWNAIPRTYQDAIIATHRLGIHMMWIDSLCIIQDSHSDWLRESKRMGAVYENARLTIAASHASDSSGPCFFTRSEPPPAVELPHVTRSGQREGSIFATLMPTDYRAISPDHGPLASRAWATQEWLLSPRMVFYTADSLMWSCKTISQRETGASHHETSRNPRWKNIVEKYSARKLTKPTDRLVALEGLRVEMGKKRGGDVYCLGLWKNSMPDQLLWYCLASAERSMSQLGLPTWTWASGMNGVRFLDMKGAKNACERFWFDKDCNTIAMRGVMRKANRSAQSLDQSPQAHLASISASMIGPPPAAAPSYLTHMLFAHDEALLGWAVLDEPGLMTGTDVFCLQLMNGRLTVKSQSSSNSKVCRSWLLLLQEDSGGVYHRVGVGVMTTQMPSFDLQSMVQVTIR